MGNIKFLVLFLALLASPALAFNVYSDGYREARQLETVYVPVSINNDASVDRSYEVSASSDLAVSVPDANVEIGSFSSETVDVAVFTGASQPGVYLVTVQVKEVESKTAKTVKAAIRVREENGLIITSYPSVLSVKQGSSVSTSFVVKNDYNTAITDLSVSIPGQDEWSINTGTILHLSPGSSGEIPVTIRVPSTVAVDEYLANALVSSSLGSRKVPFTLRVLSSKVSPTKVSISTQIRKRASVTGRLDYFAVDLYVTNNEYSKLSGLTVEVEGVEDWSVKSPEAFSLEALETRQFLITFTPNELLPEINTPRIRVKDSQNTTVGVETIRLEIVEKDLGVTDAVSSVTGFVIASIPRLSMVEPVASFFGVSATAFTALLIALVLSLLLVFFGKGWYVGLRHKQDAEENEALLSQVYANMKKLESENEQLKRRMFEPEPDEEDVDKIGEWKQKFLDRKKNS